MRYVLLLCCLFITTATTADIIKPFKSDGCSAFPDGTFLQKKLWLSCCTAHDYAYWQGGTYDERLAADYQLKQCVAKVGEKQIADIMLAGVRVGDMAGLIRVSIKPLASKKSNKFVC